MAKEGDQAVIADDHHVLEGVERPIARDDALDFQPDQVFGEGARGGGIGLQVGGLDQVILADVDDHAGCLRGQRVEVRRHGAQVVGRPALHPARPARIPEDDAAVAARCRRDQARGGARGQGGNRADRPASTGEHRHRQVEGLGEAEGTIATAHPDVDVGGVVPGIAGDRFAGGAVLGRNADQASGLGRGIRRRDRGRAGHGACSLCVLYLIVGRVRVGTIRVPRIGVRGIRVRRIRVRRIRVRRIRIGGVGVGRVGVRGIRVGRVGIR